MSVKDLIRDTVSNGSTTLSTYKFPTKIGCIMDRYQQLKTYKWSERSDSKGLNDMSKPIISDK